MLLLDQLKVSPEMVLPLASRATALYWRVAPAAMELEVGDTLTDDTAGGVSSAVELPQPIREVLTTRLSMKRSCR